MAPPDWIRSSLQFVTQIVTSDPSVIAPIRRNQFFSWLITRKKSSLISNPHSLSKRKVKILV